MRSTLAPLPLCHRRETRDNPPSMNRIRTCTALPHRFRKPYIESKQTPPLLLLPRARLRKRRSDGTARHDRRNSRSLYVGVNDRPVATAARRKLVKQQDANLTVFTWSVFKITFRREGV